MDERTKQCQLRLPRTSVALGIYRSGINTPPLVAQACTHGDSFALGSLAASFAAYLVSTHFVLKEDELVKQVHMDAVIRQGSQRGKLHHLRQTGWVPAVVYGGTDPAVSIAVPERALVGDAAADSRFVELSVEGKTVTAMIKGIQRHPVSRKITHVEFYRVDTHHPTDVHVPVQLHGVEEAQKRGLIVQQQSRGVMVRALPQNVPEFLTVDLSTLEIGHHVTIGEVPLPEGVELLSDPAEVLVSILVASRAAVEEETDTATAAPTPPAATT